ncbi:MAG: hypothetical protein IJU20_08250 [Clostridia bacterium]|nr:hypothetical protein [Clostridia bacterium]
MKINENYSAPEFKRYEEFHYFPPEQIEIEEQTSLNVAEHLQDIPESSVEPVRARSAPEYANLFEKKAREKKRNSKKAGDDRNAAWRADRRQLKGVAKIRTLTHKVAESVSAMAGSVAAAVAAVVIGVAVLTNLIEPAPAVDSFALEVGQDCIQYTAELSELNEKQDYEWQVMQGQEIVSSMHAQTGRTEGFFDGLEPGTAYRLRLAGDNGEVGGFVEYFSESFVTFSRAEPRALIRLERMAFENEPRPDFEQEMEEARYLCLVRLSDLDGVGSDYRLYITAGQEEMDSYEIPEEETEFSCEFWVGPWLETDELYLYVECNIGGETVRVGEKYLKLGASEPVGPSEPTAVRYAGVFESDAYLVFEVEAGKETQGLVLSYTLYGNETFTETVPIEFEQGNLFSWSVLLDYEDASYSWKVLRAGEEDGEVLAGGDEIHSLSGSLLEFDASYTPVPPEEGEWEQTGDGMVLRLDTGFTTGRPGVFALRVECLDENGEVIGSYFGGDSVASIPLPDRESLAQVVYSSVGMLRREHVYDRYEFRYEPGEDRLHVNIDALEDWTLLTLYVYPEGGMELPQGLVMYVTLSSPDEPGESEPYGVELLEQDGGMYAVGEVRVPVGLSDRYYSYELYEGDGEDARLLAAAERMQLSYDRTVYGAELAEPDVNEWHDQYVLSGRVEWNSGFRGDPDAFGYRIELFGPDGEPVGEYLGSDETVEFEPEGEFVRVCLAKVGYFAQEYLYGETWYDVFIPEAEADVEESLSALTIQGTSNLSGSDRTELNLRAVLYGNEERVVEETLIVQEDGTFDCTLGLLQEETAFRFTLTGRDTAGKETVLFEQNRTALQLSHAYGASFEVLSADEAMALSAESEDGTIRFETGFHAEDPIFYYGITLTDDEGRVRGSYEGRDTVVEILPDGDWTTLTYTRYGEFKEVHQYESTSSAVFAGEASVDVHEELSRLRFEGVMNLTDADYETVGKLSITLYGTEESTVVAELETDENGRFETEIDLKYDTAFYSYALSYRTPAGTDKVIRSAEHVALTLSHEYGASFEEIDADHAAAGQSNGTVPLQTGFSATDELFYYVVKLTDGTGATVASYRGTDPYITLTPSGDWTTVTYEKWGAFAEPHLYGSTSYTKFVPVLSGVQVHETAGNLTLTGTTNLQQAPYDTGLKVVWTQDGGQGSERSEELSIQGAFESVLALDRESTTYRYVLYYRNLSGEWIELKDSGQTALMVSHQFPSRLTILSADEAYALQGDGLTLSLDTGFASDDPTFYYTVRLLDASGGEVASYSGRDASAVLLPTGDWTVLVYETHGAFAEDYVYETHSSERFIPNAQVQVTESVNHLHISGNTDLLSAPNDTQPSLILTLNGQTSETIRAELEVTDGIFSYDAPVYQDTSSYRLRLVYTDGADIEQELYDSGLCALQKSHDYGATFTPVSADEIYSLMQNGTVSFNTGFTSRDDAFYYRVTVYGQDGQIAAQYEGRDAQITLEGVDEFASVTYESLGEFREVYLYETTESERLIPEVGNVSNTEFLDRLEVTGTTNALQAGYEIALELRYELTQVQAETGGPAGNPVQGTIALQLTADGTFTAAVPLDFHTQSYSYVIGYQNGNSDFVTLYSSDTVPLTLDRTTFGAAMQTPLASEAEVVWEDGDLCTVTLQTGFDAGGEAAYAYRATLINEDMEEIQSVLTRESELVFESVPAAGSLHVRYEKLLVIGQEERILETVEETKEGLLMLDAPSVSVMRSSSESENGDLILAVSINSPSGEETYHTLTLTYAYDDGYSEVAELNLEEIDFLYDFAEFTVPVREGATLVRVQSAQLSMDGPYGGNARSCSYEPEGEFEFEMSLNLSLVKVTRQASNGAFVPAFEWSASGAGSQDAVLRIRDNSIQVAQVEQVYTEQGSIVFSPDDFASSYTSGTHELVCTLEDAQGNVVKTRTFTLDLDSALTAKRNTRYNGEYPSSYEVILTYNGDGTRNMYIKNDFQSDDGAYLLVDISLLNEEGMTLDTLTYRNEGVMTNAEDLPQAYNYAVVYRVMVDLDEIPYCIEEYSMQGSFEDVERLTSVEGGFGANEDSDVNVWIYGNENLLLDPASAEVSLDGQTYTPVTLTAMADTDGYVWSGSGEEYVQAEQLYFRIQGNNYAYQYETLSAEYTFKGEAMTTLTYEIYN